MKTTVTTYFDAKKNHEKLTMLTAYDYSTAKLLAQAGVDSILVGDSLGNVMLGYDDTLSVTVEDMIHHCAAVKRGAPDTLVVCDMPFMSYQTSDYDALVNAGRLMKEGHANAVKIEGGAKLAPRIKKIVDAGIPVCGHIGLTPQSINAFGGYKVQGKSLEAGKQLVYDAMALEEAGCFAITLECVPSDLAAYITSKLKKAATIGIGAGNETDAQVLVYADMLGMFSDYVPKFVKHFAEVGKEIRIGVEEYSKAVKSGSYPATEHTYKIDAEVLQAIKDATK